MGGRRSRLDPSKPAVLTACCTVQNRHMIAGAAARTLAQCLVHPIDTVKTRLQVSMRRSTVADLAGHACIGILVTENAHSAW